MISDGGSNRASGGPMQWRRAHRNGGGGGAAAASHAVFVGDFTYVDRDFEELAELFFDFGAEWAKEAELSAARQRLRLTEGLPRRSSSAVTVPVRLEPVDEEAMTPSLDADIELLSLGRGHCRLGLSGRYRTSRDGASDRDRMAVQRAAEMATRRVLNDVAASLSPQAS